MTNQDKKLSKKEKFGLPLLFLAGTAGEAVSISYLIKFIKQENIGSQIRNIFDQIPKNIFDMPGFREKLLSYSGIASLGYKVRMHRDYHYIKIDDHPFATLKPNSLDDILKGELNSFGYDNSSGKYIQYFSDSKKYALLLDTNQCAKEYLEELIKKSPELKTPEIENFLTAVEKQKELYQLHEASRLPIALCMSGIIVSAALIITTLIIGFCVARKPKAEMSDTLNPTENKKNPPLNANI